MDLEEAKEKAKITPEEIQAVGSYINMYHAEMNSIIGFDMVNYIKSSERWNLPGVRTDKSKEEIGDKVLDVLEQSSLVYSVMVKNTHKNSPPPTLMRGTSTRAANALRGGSNCDRILSTTTDETTAKSFTAAGEDAALLRIYPDKDIPFLDVTEFFGEENLNRMEHEIILAPFAKVSESKHVSDWNGYSYYNVKLSKPRMRSFKEGEKDKLASEIKEGFADAIKEGQEYVRAQTELNEVNRSLSTETNRNNLKMLYARQERAMAITDKLRPKIREFESKMSMYAQGLFVEKEREAVQARDIVAEDNRKQKFNQKLVEVRENRSKVKWNRASTRSIL